MPYYLVPSHSTAICASLPVSDTALKTLLLLLALGLLTAPLMAAWPSAAERRRGALRRCAMRLGLRVRLADMQQTGATAASYDRDIAYSLVLPPRAGAAEQGRRRWLRTGDTWQVQGGGAVDRSSAQRLERVLDALPQSVHAVECGVGNIAAYWHEEGTEADVARIAEALRTARGIS